MFVTILIIIVILLFIYSIVTTIGTIKGMKKSEFYEEYIKNIRDKISESYMQMKEIDTVGAFEADDEVGITFQNLKEVIDNLNVQINEEITEN